MDEEELQPKNRKPQPKNLEEMSIEALRDYVKELQAEIARAREMIAAKEEVRLGAQALFKPK